MNKTKFEGFLNRYSLGGEVEAVIIRSDGNSVTTEMVSDNRTMIGSVTMEEDTFPNGTFPILTTSLLKQFLSVLDNNVEVDVKNNALVFRDEVSKVDYILAEESVVPAVPSVKALPDFTVTVKMDDEFVNRFIKSTRALSDSDRFTFVSNGTTHEIVLGYASTSATNRISITVEADVPGPVGPISFSAHFLTAILNNNRGSTESSLKISPDGLCSVSFTGGNYSSQYYIAQIDGEA